MTIRLVKGAYWDQETIKAAQKHWGQPVYNDKAATDANFRNHHSVVAREPSICVFCHW